MSVKFGLQFERQYPDKFYRTRFEDIILNPETELKKICKFLNLDYQDRQLDTDIDSGTVTDACGIPVIGSDSGEIPYVIKDAGVVVGEKDELGWVRTISELLESPSLRQELAAKGLERARSVYAWPIVARQHLEFFTEILESPKKENTN